jgi:hypothetical protein
MKLLYYFPPFNQVHLEYYRLPTDIVQIAKMGKILLAAEEGRPLTMADDRPDDMHFTLEGRDCSERRINAVTTVWGCFSVQNQLFHNCIIHHCFVNFTVILKYVLS